MSLVYIKKSPVNSMFTRLPPPVSGYQDSNLGPSAPKADALTGLRYTPLIVSANINGKIYISKFFN